MSKRRSKSSRARCRSRGSSPLPKGPRIIRLGDGTTIQMSTYLGRGALRPGPSRLNRQIRTGYRDKLTQRLKRKHDGQGETPPPVLRTSRIKMPKVERASIIKRFFTRVRSMR